MGAGALAGSSVGPWGAIVGGGLGALAGAFGAYEAEQDAKRKKQILRQAMAQFNLTQDEVDSLLAEYYNNPDNFLGTQEDVDAYRKSIAEYDPSNFVGDYEAFDYGKSVDDFVNPYYDKIISDTSKQISHSAAGAGVGRGTGAANAIAKGVAEKEDQLYNTALNAYNTDRSQSYTEWAGNIDKMQARLNALKSATDTKLNMQGNLANDYTAQRQNAMADEIAAKQNRNNGNLQLASMGLMI
jgi:hypothetical protein